MERRAGRRLWLASSLPLAGGARRGKMADVKLFLWSLLVPAACAGLLAGLVAKVVIPRFLLQANQEMVADLRGGLSECHAETGSWPDLSDPRQFGLLMYNVIGADGRRIPGGYMNGRSGEFSGGMLPDVYGQPLKFSVVGDQVLVASSGPNRIWGDADDVSSDQVQERWQPATLAQARAEAEQRAAKKKS